MKVPLVFLVALSTFLAPGSRAQDSAEFAAAAAPLLEGVPEVAVARLQALLNKNLPEQEWRAVAGKLTEALIVANQPAAALNLLADTRLRDFPAVTFWRAQALAGLSRPSEALPLFEELARDRASPFHIEALFGAAEMLRALGRSDEALQRFSSLERDQQWGVRAQLRAAELFLDKSDAANAKRLLDKMQPKSEADKKERHFLKGRLEIVSHAPDKAAATLESLLKRPEGASHAVLLAALFAIADAHLQLQTPEMGDDVLEDFVEHHPEDVDLARVFAKLDELYRAERKPSRTELEKWTRDPAQPRRGFAQWYLARLQLRAGRRDRALELFAALRRSKPKFNALAPAFLEFAQLELQDGHFDEALAILNDARALQPETVLLDRINLLSAQTQYRAKRFAAATATFEQIAHSPSPFATMSMFNASLGWLQLGDQAHFLADYQELTEKGGDEESRTELRLEEGLVQATNSDPRASESLQRFLRDFPGNKRASEAWVALAELAFHAAPPRLDEARKNLARAVEAKPTAAAAERGDYLAIWIEDSVGSNDAKMIELAKRFLVQHGASGLVPTVRMKLAEVYYRQQDFSNAQTQFEILAAEDPAGPLTPLDRDRPAQPAKPAPGTAVPPPAPPPL